MRVIPLPVLLSMAMLLSLAPVACIAQSAPDNDSIRASRAASNAAIAAGDAKAFAANLEPAFVVVTGNGSFLSREAYIAAFAKDFADPQSVRFERTADSIDLSTSLPLAAEHGHWVGHVPGGPVLFSGTYLAMWRKSGSRWNLRSELFVALACSDKAACDAYRKMYQSPHRLRHTNTRTLDMNVGPVPTAKRVALPL
jgi:ketosteroid isomerase-like protein